MNNCLLTKIKEDFLESYPKQFHSIITNLNSFKNYFDYLKTFEKIKIYKEHKDYAINNIINGYLFDFEFSTLFQPIGFDKNHFEYTLTQTTNNKMYLLKIKLINEINKIIDSSINTNKNKIHKIIFSITNQYSNNKKYKVITILGIKFKFRQR